MRVQSAAENGDGSTGHDGGRGLHTRARRSNPRTPRTAERTLLLGYAGLVAAIYATAVLVDGTVGQLEFFALAYPGVVAAAAGAVIVGIRRYRPTRAGLWWPVPAALSLLFTESLASTADLAVSPLLSVLAPVVAWVTVTITIWRLVRARSARFDVDALLDCFIVGVSLVAILGRLVGVARGMGNMPANPPLLAALIVLPALVFSVALLLLFAAPDNTAGRLLFTAAAASLAGNVVALVYEATGALGTEVAMHGWTGSFVLLGAAALCPDMAALTTSSQHVGDRLPYARLTVLTVALVTALVGVLLEARVAPHTSLVAAAAIAVTVLVVVRMLRLVTDLERTRRAQGALAALGHQLLDEPSLERLQDALVRTALDVSGAVRCTLWRDEGVHGVRHLATAGAHDRPPTRPSGAPQFGAGQLGAARSDTGVLVPISDDGAPWGTLEVVAGQRGAVRNSVLPTLTTIADMHTQVLRRHAAEQALREQALHDCLTGLPNRYGLRRLLAELLDAPDASDERIGLLFADLDGFKQVNDTLGHAAGDAVLIDVARRLRLAVRPGDAVARLGGDEFVAVCRDLATDGVAQQIAERIAAALRQPFLLDAGTAAVTTSIGIAVRRIGQIGSVEEILRDADRAMYRAKHTGKDGICV